MADAEESEASVAEDFVAVSSVGELYSRGDIDNALDDLIKQHTLLVLPAVVFVGLVMILGLAGNALASLMHYKHFPPSAIRSLNLSLSAVGLVASVVCCPEEIVEMCMKYTLHSAWSCRAFRGLKGALTFSSAFLLVAVAVYRYNTVCCKSRRLWTIKDARVAVVVCVIVAVSLSTPLVVLSGRHTITMTAIKRTSTSVLMPNVSVYTCGVEDAFVGSTFVLMNNVVMATAYICGVVVVTVSYAQISRHVLRRRKRSSRKLVLRARENGTCVISPIERRGGFHVTLSTLFVDPVEGTSRISNESSPVPARLCISRDTCTQETSFVNEKSDTIGMTCSSDGIKEVFPSILLDARAPKPGEEAGLSRDHQKQDTMTRVICGSPSYHCEPITRFS
ncbi:hypothetical protein C0Q70_07231 [Pomacea canaliculata]|uniref:G-protein coupled receptors family 1 profile domain-containing protein n=1 Tax=Pomacea canaliculata TaxID=400727 RepID=A0A2T7PEH4_POMCA|nr:hypothetical protein C0Q70_07231 [Pomacea canaliculata]